jgi:hypothetical protein
MRTLLLLFCWLLPALSSLAQKSCGTEYYQSQIRQLFPQSIYRNGIQLPSSISDQEDFFSGDQGQTIIIPVVVHLLYNTSVNEMTDEKIQSQINILNRDFNPTDLSSLSIPAVFMRVAGRANIRFELAKVDPNGRATTGITRKKSSRLLWGNDDKIKDPSYGGVAPWDAGSYLNIWLGNLVPGLLGYASAPGSPANKDGVVIKTAVFGEAGGSYSRGRTTVHEVGHWLNLQHLWGDGTCGSDEVDDTPPQKTFNQGCPGFPKLNNSCGNGDTNGEMFMNFMDFTDDACMIMFTKGQVSRMRNLFFPGGVRASLLQSKGLGTPWNTGEPVVVTDSEGNEATVNVKTTPQPVVSSVVLTASNGSLHQVAYSLYSMEGRALRNGILTGETPLLNIANLRPGVYFIKLNGYRKAVRIVKQ